MKRLIVIIFFLDVYLIRMTNIVKADDNADKALLSTTPAEISVTPSFTAGPTGINTPTPTSFTIKMNKIPTIAFPTTAPTAIVNQPPGEQAPNVPTIAPIVLCQDKKGEMNIKAPSKLDFPEAKVFSLEQWTNTRDAMDMDQNPITIVSKSSDNCKDKIPLVPTVPNSAANERSKSGNSGNITPAVVVQDNYAVGWTVTVTSSDLTSKDDLIASDNLRLLTYRLQAVEGNTDGIVIPKEVRFLVAETPYLLAKADQGSGDGVFSVYFNLLLRIPPNTPQGDYVTRMELTII